jgi:hypothetical protein
LWVRRGVGKTSFRIDVDWKKKIIPVQRAGREEEEEEGINENALNVFVI